MSKILNLSDEIALIDSPDFELGKYIYLGQVRTEDDATAVVSVAYKANYAARKLKENLQTLKPGTKIVQCYLRKVRVGETDDCGKIPLDC